MHFVKRHDIQGSPYRTSFLIFKNPIAIFAIFLTAFTIENRDGLYYNGEYEQYCFTAEGEFGYG